VPQPLPESLQQLQTLQLLTQHRSKRSGRCVDDPASDTSDHDTLRDVLNAMDALTNGQNGPRRRRR
jgi:hypothetical protein